MAVRRGSFWIGLALLGSLGALALATSSDRSIAAGSGQPTGKEISAYENSQTAAFLGEVQKMKCKVKSGASGKRFHATGKTINGAYGLNITILKFKGFSKHYAVPFGVLSPNVAFEGSGRDYDNVFPFPGGTPPPGGAGQIAFSGGGKRVGLGIYSLPNQDYSQGVALAGSAKCIYP